MTTFNNYGLVRVDNGTLTLEGGGDSTGTFAAAAGATLGFGTNLLGIIQSTQTLEPGSRVQGSGTVQFLSGIVNVSGEYRLDDAGTSRFAGATVHFKHAISDLGSQARLEEGTVDFSTGSAVVLPALVFSFGTLTGSDPVTVAGKLDWSGGTMAGTSSTTVAFGGTLNLSGILILDGRTLNNGGTAKWAGQAQYYGISVTNHPTINNLAGASFIVANDANIGTTGTPLEATFNNAGRLVKTGGTGATELLGLTFNNTGAVEVQSGRLVLVGAGDSTGTFAVSAGAVIGFGEGSYGRTQTLEDGSSILGAGTVVFGGGTVNVAGTVDLSGEFAVRVDSNNGTLRFTRAPNSLGRHVVINSGTVDFSSGAPVVLPILDITGGTLTGSDTVTITDALKWTGQSAMTGLAGATVVAAGATFDLSGQLTLDRRKLINAGVATWSGEGTYDSLVLSDSATIENLVGGRFTIATDRILGAGYPSPGPFENAGTLIKAAGTLTSVLNGVVLHNIGTLEVQGGDLSLPSLTVDGPGILDGRAGASIHISGDLTGTSRNADRFNPPSTVALDGSGYLSRPQRLEAMSQDRGASPAGLDRNFAYETLQIGAPQYGDYVQLVDNADNAPGTGAESLYVDSLVVSQFSTLDLNGLHVYARTAVVSGTIVNGSVALIPDGGPIPINATANGSIASAGEVDDWSFFARGGQDVGVTVHTGALGQPAPATPSLGAAQVTLLDSAGRVVATATNSQPGGDAVIPATSLPDDGIYHITVGAPASAAASTGDYVLSTFGASQHDTPVTLGQQVNGQLDTPISVDRWEFAARGGQQVQFQLVAVASPDIQFDLTGPGGYVGFTGLSADSPRLTLPSDGSYTLTVHAAHQQGGAYAFVLQAGVIDLTLGTPFDGTLAGSGQTQAFRVQVSTPGPLQVVLRDPRNTDQNEVYVKFGAPPTRKDYDYRYSRTASANQLITIPQAVPGTWYILVYSALVPVPGGFTLGATTSTVYLDGVSPPSLGNVQDDTLTLNGAGFDDTTTVDLIAADGTSYPAHAVNPTSPTSLIATFKAATVRAGRYSVRVTKIDGATAALSNAFTVVEGGHAILQTNLVVPSRLAVHLVPATIEIEYSNTGTDAMPAPILILTATQGSTQAAFMTLDPSIVQWGIWNYAVPDGFTTSIQFVGDGATPGLLQPGESIRVPVYWAGWLASQWDANTPIIFHLSAMQSNDPTPIDWPALKDGLRPSNIAPDAWNSIFPNLEAQFGSTWGQYIARLDADATYLAGLGENVTDLGRLFSFELEQAIGFSPRAHLASALDAAVPATGLSLTVNRVFSSSIVARDLLGPFGRGWWWADGWSQTLSISSDGTVTIDDGDGSQHRFQPDVRGGYFDQVGDHATLTNLGGGVYTRTQPNGLVTAFRSDGKVDYVQDTNGNRVTAGYTDGLLTSLTHSSGQSLQIAYNGAGRISSIIDPASARGTTYHYDATNEHLLSVTSFDHRTTTYTYDVGTNPATVNALLSTAYPDNTKDLFSYDVEGRLSDTHRDGGAGDIAYSYGSVGTVSATGADNGTTTYSFDQMGMIAKVEDPLQRVTRLSYDGGRNLTRVTDSNGQTHNYRYDAEDRLIQSTDPLGHTTSFRYDGPFHRLTSSADANGNVTRYGYDSNGNEASAIYADGTVERIGYEASGDPTTLTNRRGNPVSYRYDTSGRITSETFADGTQAIYQYDARGNLTSSTDARGTTTLIYDGIDQLKEIVYPDGLFLKYTYDAAGRRTQMLEQTGLTVDYAYDAAGRLAKLTDGAGALIDQYTYDAMGRLIREDKGNGTFTTYEYDLGGEITQVVNRAPDGSVNSRFDYTYDDLGRETNMTTLDGQWTYSYDAIGELTHAVFASNKPASSRNQDLQYQYDAAGNRTRTVINGVTTDYVSNNLNEYTSIGSERLAYDSDGNLISKSSAGGTETFSYNDANRLTGVSTPDGHKWAYQYDAFGNRIAVTEGGDTIHELNDPLGLAGVAGQSSGACCGGNAGWVARLGLANLVGEYSGSGSPIAQYVHGLGLTSRTDATGATNYYDADGFGSMVGFSNSGGSYAAEYRYLPFGESLDTGSVASNSFRFAGQLGVAAEANGLAYMRARYYDASTGRFTSPDPVGFTGGLNLYQYAGNNPVTVADPSGLAPSQPYPSSYGSWGGSITGSFFAPFGGQAGIVFGPNGIGFSVCSGIGTPGLGAAGTYYPDGPTTGLGLAWDWGAYVGREVPVNVGPFSGNEGWSLTNPGMSAAVCWTWPPTWCPWCSKPPSPPPSPGPDGPSQPVHSYDPNDKIGPAGFGPVGFIAPGRPLPYRIDFENEAIATAPAQRVVVTDQLDRNFDWTTFALTAVGFGDHNMTIPPGTQHFQTTVDVSENGQAIQVDIELGLNPETGLVTATFQTIDPRTQLPPDVLTGFLPPEDGTGRGKGYFTYLVAPRTDLPTGTQLRNVATITFDANAPITTDQADPHDPSKGIDPAKEDRITIDAGSPTSRIAPLPPTEQSTSFVVSWSGHDDPDGSGIATYNVDFSDNGGPFVPFLTATTQTSATFDGINGHSYRFWCAATDNVGNRESTPASAQASTEVEATSSSSTPPPAGSLVVEPVAAPVQPVRAGTSVSVSAGFRDSDATGGHTAIWHWGDGTSSSATVNESPGSGSAAGSHVYAVAGLYQVNLTVIDPQGGAGAAMAVQDVVVYDPTAGSITGRGRFLSRLGAFPNHPTLAGTVTFQLGAKYKTGGGVPGGKLVLKLTSARLSFRSTRLDWLVVAGSTVWYQGIGTVNGAGAYGFLVSARVGKGSGKLRFRIWDRTTGAIFYDTQPGAPIDAAPTTSTTGGRIALHGKHLHR